MDLELLKCLGAPGTAKLSQFKGKISSVYFHLASSPQFSLQPPCGKDNKIPDAILFDCHVVDVGKLLTAKELPRPEAATVGLGDQVEDQVTGLVGIVTVVFFGFNGCCEVLVVSKHNKRNPKGVSIVVNTKRLEVIQSAIIPTTAAPGKGAIHPTKALTRSA